MSQGDASVAGAGGPPYHGDMEPRVTALETRLDTILPTLATKADIADMRADMQTAHADQQTLSAAFRRPPQSRRQP